MDLRPVSEDAFERPLALQARHDATITVSDFQLLRQSNDGVRNYG